MFIEKVNKKTGEREWVVAEEDYDLAQEMACSRFGDMILDYDRNDMFLEGLKTVIAEKKEKGEEVHVLDIGTGTGLLSLMAAREGADRVTALEVFTPMAQCANNIVANSEYKDKIKVISSRSTDLSKLPDKPNVIVAEVFDTELIGEGALRTFKEALESLVQKGTRVVPSTSRVYVLPVESEFLASFNRIPTLVGRDSEGCPLKECPGACAVFDVQLSELTPERFKKLSEDKATAFTFDFEDPEKIIYDESNVIEIPITRSGRVDAILMWWDLDMDGQGKNFIDMAPTWYNPQSQWRDHWMQAVYYLPHASLVQKGQTLRLRCSHDEFSLWFSDEDDAKQMKDRTYCVCGMHSLLLRYNIFRMNEVMRDETIRSVMSTICPRRSVLCVNEGSLIGLLAAEYAERVIILDSNQHFRRILCEYRQYYKLDNVMVVENIADVDGVIDVVLGEPFFLSSISLRDNLRFWFEVEKVRAKWPAVEVYPRSARLMGVCERFTDLQKTSDPVGTVNGFDLSHFDDLNQKARQMSTPLVDTHSLWEYDGVLTGAPFQITDFVFSKSPEQSNAEMTVELSGGTNGIPMWLEWDWTEGRTTTTGLRSPGKGGEKPDWHPGYKQDVYLLPPSLRSRGQLTIKADFNSLSGEVQLCFE